MHCLAKHRIRLILTNIDIIKWTKGVPIEVVPFAYAKVLQNLHRLGSPNAHLRMAVAKAGPIVSDNGNFIIDAPFESAHMRHPLEVTFLERPAKCLHDTIYLPLAPNKDQNAYGCSRSWAVLSHGKGSVLWRGCEWCFRVLLFCCFAVFALYPALLTPGIGT